MREFFNAVGDAEAAECRYFTQGDWPTRLQGTSVQFRFCSADITQEFLYRIHELTHKKKRATYL